jgi:hypothetical protein
MTQRKKRIVLAVLALLLLPLFCLILIRQQILSPTEEALVGLWYYDVADNPALTSHRVFMELRGNHRCFLRGINYITGEEFRSNEGWWSVQDGLLRLDWRGKWGGLSPLELSANGSIQRKQWFDDNEIVEINDDGMIVLPRYPRKPFYVETGQRVTFT